MHSSTIIPLTRLSAYGFLAVPLAAAFIALQVIVPTHYAETTNLSLSAIGGIVLLARLWDMATDPIVGILSDKTPQYLGRRRLWVLLSLPLIAIAVYKLFNPPDVAGTTYLLLWTFAIYAAGTMAIVPLNAWGAELSPDYHQRNRVTGARAAFGLMGTLVALSIPALLGEAGSDSLSSSLLNISILVIVSLVVAATLIIWVPDNTATQLPPTQIREAWLLLSKPSPLRQLLVSFLSNSTANAIPATLFLFYVTYVLQSAEKAGLMLFLYFICAAISVPIWIRIATRYGKHRTWFWSIITACGFFLWTPFLNQDDLTIYLIIVIGTGFTTGCDLIIPSSMNGDLIEWDANNAGYRRPGLFFALWGTTTKLAYALAIGIAFPLLDILGFNAGTDNSLSTITALAWVYGLPCILFKAIALWNMHNYPITEDRYQELLKANETQKI